MFYVTNKSLAIVIVQEDVSLEVWVFKKKNLRSYSVIHTILKWPVATEIHFWFQEEGGEEFSWTTLTEHGMYPSIKNYYL